MTKSFLRPICIDGRSQEWILVTCLALAALASRAYGIWQWELIQDEYFTVTRAAERFPSFTNPAIYGLVLASFKLFGESEWSVRLYTVVLGTISIPLFFVTWKNIVGRNAALFGAVLILFSSWHLWHSQYARYYSGVFLFSSLSFYLYYRAVRLDSMSRLVGSIVAALVAILFHVTAVMVPGACGIFSILVLAFRERMNSGFSKRIATVHLVIALITGIVALPFLLDLAIGWYGSGIAWGHNHPVVMFLKIVRDAGVPIVVAALGGLIGLLYSNRLDAIFLFIGIVIPLLVVSVGSALVPIRTDYYFYSMPLAFLLAGCLCEQARTAMKEFGLTAYAVFALVLLGSLPSFVFYYSDRMTLDVRDAVAYVTQRYRFGDRIVSFGTGYQYYFGDEYPTERIGNAYDDERWRERLEPYENTDGRVWFMLRVRRSPLTDELENWLLQNAVLVWRKNSRRFDESVRGYEIFLVDNSVQLTQGLTE